MCSLPCAQAQFGLRTLNPEHERLLPAGHAWHKKTAEVISTSEQPEAEGGCYAPALSSDRAVELPAAFGELMSHSEPTAWKNKSAFERCKPQAMHFRHSATAVSALSSVRLAHAQVFASIKRVSCSTGLCASLTYSETELMDFRSLARLPTAQTTLAVPLTALSAACTMKRQDGVGISHYTVQTHRTYDAWLPRDQAQAWCLQTN